MSPVVAVFLAGSLLGAGALIAQGSGKKKPRRVKRALPAKKPVPKAPPTSDPPDAPAEKDPDVYEWPPDPHVTLGSTRLFVAPDCSDVTPGSNWATDRKDRMVLEAARDRQRAFDDGDEEGGPSASVVLNTLLFEDAPLCVDAGMDHWGPLMLAWYEYWVSSIQNDLDMYEENSDLLYPEG